LDVLIVSYLFYGHLFGFDLLFIQIQDELLRSKRHKEAVEEQEKLNTQRQLLEIEEKAARDMLEQYQKKIDLLSQKRQDIQKEEKRVAKKKKVADDAALKKAIRNAADIYNADESSLFYKALPQGTLAVRGDNPSGGKHQKERLTILFLCNQDGSDKKAFVVGKCAKPRAFKNVSNLPLPYYHNKKAWMTCELWSRILSEFDRKLQMEHREILLFADNATCHTLVNVQLTNIKVLFLPPNTTSLIQPLDQGIIKNVKVKYRQQLMRKQLSILEGGESVNEFYKQITILTAINMLKCALLQLQSTTIQNCFRKAGFDVEAHFPFEIIDLDEEEACHGLKDEEFEEWMKIDDDVSCYGELSDEDIIASVIPLQLWPNIVKYIGAHEATCSTTLAYLGADIKKPLKRPNCKSFSTIEGASKDPLFTSKLNFFKCISDEVKPFLCRYQTDAPMMPFLEHDLQDMLMSLPQKVFFCYRFDNSFIFKIRKLRFRA
jgi:hypothetical protein